MRDEILPINGCYVLNLDTTDNEGTHWVAVYGNEYYDSFGLAPPNKLSHCVYNIVQHQELNSTLCGIYCMFYIWSRNRGLPKYNICYNILKPKSNKKWILKWFRHIVSSAEK